MRLTVAVAAFVVACLSACGGEPMAFEISSPAFANGKRIPVEYTGEGEDVSPPLAWRGVPAGTEQLVLIVDDPDAPTPEPWVHWLLASLKPDLTGLARGEDGGGRAGRNSWHKAAYGGPMPPPGHGVHHYRFRLYALDFWLELPTGQFTRRDLEAGMKGHVVGMAELVGTYDRNTEPGS